MLQRYDLTIDGEANQLSIKEFAVLGRISRNRETFDPTKEKYLFVHKVSYDGDIIRAAIQEGKDALISELRTDAFFPVRSCAERIAEGVIDLFNTNSDPDSKVFFDDQTLLPKLV